MVQIILLQSSRRRNISCRAARNHPPLWLTQVSHSRKGTPSRGRGGRRTASWTNRFWPPIMDPILWTMWSWGGQHLVFCQTRISFIRACVISWKEEKKKAVKMNSVNLFYLFPRVHSWQLDHWLLHHWAGCPWKVCFQYPWTLSPAYGPLKNKFKNISN